jgi:hypothetical protein
VSAERRASRWVADFRPCCTPSPLFRARREGAAARREDRAAGGQDGAAVAVGAPLPAPVQVAQERHVVRVCWDGGGVTRRWRGVSEACASFSRHASRPARPLGPCVQVEERQDVAAHHRHRAHHLHRHRHARVRRRLLQVQVVIRRPLRRACVQLLWQVVASRSATLPAADTVKAVSAAHGRQAGAQGARRRPVRGQARVHLRVLGQLACPCALKPISQGGYPLPDRAVWRPRARCSAQPLQPPTATVHQSLASLPFAAPIRHLQLRAHRRPRALEELTFAITSRDPPARKPRDNHVSA